MKKSIVMTLLVVSTAIALTACGKKEKEAEVAPVEVEIEPISEEANEEEVVEEETTDVLPEGMVYSELTGLPIDQAIEKQKPIAAMVDNESTALPHFGLNSADIIYEMVNSTANDRFNLCKKSNLQSLVCSVIS